MKARLKRLAKAMARPLWRLAAPVRRRLACEFDERVRRIVESVVQANWQGCHVTVEPPDLSRLEAMVGELSAALGMARKISEHHAEEANLLMDGLVREIARLQLQLESLAELVSDSRSGSGSSLVVVGEEDGQLRVG
jgi:hypothetical protein